MDAFTLIEFFKLLVTIFPYCLLEIITDPIVMLLIIVLISLTIAKVICELKIEKWKEEGKIPETKGFFEKLVDKHFNS